MKNLITFLAIALVVFVSCEGNKSRQSGSHNISTEIKKNIRGEVILPDNGSCNYYDIAVTEDYYAFLDYYSDTILQVLDKKDFSLREIGLREKDTFTIAYPSFAKYDYANKGRKNAITLWENEKFQMKRIDLDNLSIAPFVTSDSLPLPIEMNVAGSTNACILSNRAFTVPFHINKPSVFISGNKTNGIFHVPPFPDLKNYLPEKVLRQAYASDLVVNEKKDRVVAALRFVSSVNFYNLNGDLQSAACYGEHYTIPVADITGKYMEVDHSIKSFIDICASDKYVFCLYDGSANFSRPSVLVVFNWDGEHLGNYQTERSLRKIAVDPAGKYLIGLAANEQGRRDVIRYQIKEIL